MKIRFLKDHVEHKAGDEVEDHPNAAYLITLGVAEDIGDSDKKKEKAADAGSDKEKSAQKPVKKKGGK